ncbi:MAG: hypothetical protein P4L73_19870 [Caulobacteraceae bacterium]|nr:hypothetical protein [Caulobacteraceae bacterium]
MGELDRLLKLRSIPFAMKLFERREAMEGMKALSRNGFRYPFPQYGVQQDVRAGMAVSYPGR